MHLEQCQFIETVKYVMPRFFSGCSVLEVGSYDVNGSVRRYFKDACPYIGIDLIEGPHVDKVCAGQDYRSDELFDVTISSETFEHTPHFLEIFENMIRLTKPGGLVLFTCAAPGRSEHGTIATSPEDSPGSTDYYRNLTDEDFGSAAVDPFDMAMFADNCVSHDLYFCGVTPGGQKMLNAFDTLVDYCKRNEDVSMAMAAAIALLRAGRPDLAIHHVAHAIERSSPLAKPILERTRDAILQRQRGV